MAKLVKLLQEIQLLHAEREDLLYQCAVNDDLIKEKVDEIIRLNNCIAFLKHWNSCNFTTCKHSIHSHIKDYLECHTWLVG